MSTIKSIKQTCIDSWLNKAVIKSGLSAIPTDVYCQSDKSIHMNLQPDVESFKVKLKLADNSNDRSIIFAFNNDDYSIFTPDRGNEYEFEFKLNETGKHIFRILNANNLVELHISEAISSIKFDRLDNLKLLDIHDNNVSELNVSNLINLDRLHIFGNPIVDCKNNLRNLYSTMNSLPNREGKRLGSIILYPWYGLETLLFYADGTHVTKNAALSIASNTSGTTTTDLINSNSKVAANQICKYPARLQFRGSIDTSKALDAQQRDYFYYDEILPEIKKNPKNSTESILYAFAVTNQGSLYNSKSHQYGTLYQHQNKQCAKIIFDELRFTYLSTLENLHVGDSVDLLNADTGFCYTTTITDINKDGAVNFNNYNFENQIIFGDTNWFLFNNTFPYFGDTKFNIDDMNMSQLFNELPAKEGLVYAVYDYVLDGWKMHPLTWYNKVRIDIEHKYTSRKNWYFGSAIQYDEEDWSKCFHQFRNVGAQDIWESTQKGFGNIIGILDSVGGTLDGDYLNSDVWQWSGNILRLENCIGQLKEPVCGVSTEWKNSGVGHGDSCIGVGAHRGNYDFGICPNAQYYARDYQQGYTTNSDIFARLLIEMSNFVTGTTSSCIFNASFKYDLGHMRYAWNKLGERGLVLNAAGNDGDTLDYTADTCTQNGKNPIPYYFTKRELGVTGGSQSANYGYIKNRDMVNRTNFENWDKRSNVVLVQALSRDYSSSYFTQLSTDACILKPDYKQYMSSFGDMVIMFRSGSGNYNKFNGTSCATPTAAASMALLRNLFGVYNPNYLGNYGLDSLFMDHVRKHWVNPMSDKPGNMSNAGSPSVLYEPNNRKFNKRSDKFESEIKSNILYVGEDFKPIVKLNDVEYDNFVLRLPYREYVSDSGENVREHRYDFALKDNVAIPVKPTEHDLILPIADKLNCFETNRSETDYNKYESMGLLTRLQLPKVGNLGYTPTPIVDNSVDDASKILYEYTSGILGLADLSLSECDEMTIQILMNYDKYGAASTSYEIIKFFVDDITANTALYISNGSNQSAYNTHCPVTSNIYTRMTCPQNKEFIDNVKYNVSNKTSYNIGEVALGSDRYTYPLVDKCNWNNNDKFTTDDVVRNHFKFDNEPIVYTLTLKDKCVSHYINGNKIRDFSTLFDVKLGQLAITTTFLISGKVNNLVYPRVLTHDEIIHNTIYLLNQK